MIAYRTTLPKRTRPVEGRDFDGLVNSVSFGKDTIKDGVDQDDLDFWNRNIDYFPEDIFKLIGQNFDQKLHMDFSFYPEADLFTIEFQQNSDRGFTASFSAAGYPVKKYVDCHITVENNFQGNGWGKGWLKAMVELNAALGFTKFKYDAAGDNGAYTWARAGVYLSMDSSDDFTDIAALSDQLIRRLEAVKKFIPEWEFEKIRSLCDLRRKDDLVKLTSMNILLPGNVLAFSDVRESLSNHFHNSPLLTEGSCRTFSEDRKAIFEAFERAAAQSKPLSLPRYLLAKGYWSAVVDFSDVDQMQKIGAYVGGWSALSATSTPIKMPALVAGIV